MAACQGLTELTVIYPHPYDTPFSKTGVQLNTVETARSATLGLVNACKELPDFDTIQIVYFLPPDQGCIVLPLSEQQSQELKKQVKGVTALAVDCLKKPGMRCREGGRRKVTVRVIELSPDYPMPHLGPVKVKEHEVYVW